MDLLQRIQDHTSHTLRGPPPSALGSAGCVVPGRLRPRSAAFGRWQVDGPAQLWGLLLVGRVWMEPLAQGVDVATPAESRHLEARPGN